jgi:2-succinyl-5-enolpyruvyl-6-hydroxy-3-cyclohexene-1-carboxylate synthase
MNPAAVQALWAELLVATLGDAGVTTCVVSPGSRSTPLVAALAADGRLALPTIIDERAAAFFALGLARATATPVALVCTSGSAAAHYLPAIVEASEAGVPLIAITADRPPELQHCGASQTIDQIRIYGGFTRAAFDLGAPHGSELALRAVRRTVIQAVTASRGPRPGPVHLNVPLRKPLEPIAPVTDEEQALAAIAHVPVVGAPPRMVADAHAVATLVARVAAEPHGIVVAGALPVGFARLPILQLCARAGYPLLAEAGSQLRFAARPGVTTIDHADFVLAANLAPPPRLIIQVGADPVAAAWPGARTGFAQAERWILGDTFHDPDGAAHVIMGDVELDVPARGASHFTRAWRDAEARAASAVEQALVAHGASEGAAIRAAVAAMPAGAVLQVGNSLPIRVVDQVATGDTDRAVITQRGAAGIDGLVASATGASWAGAPVLLILGDVSFAHDLGGLLVARLARAPLAIVVIDNGGGRIFGTLPIATSASRAAFEAHFTTRPELDIVAVATALGHRAVSATTPAALGRAVAAALAEPGVTIIHAPVAETGARDLRLSVLEHLTGARHG